MSEADRTLMEKYGITCNPKMVYHYKAHRYENLKDAIFTRNKIIAIGNHARINRNSYLRYKFGTPGFVKNTSPRLRIKILDS